MRISIKAALAGLFALLTIIIAAESALTLVKLSAIRHSATEVAGNWLPSVQTLGELKAGVDSARIRQYRLVAATRDAQQLATHRKQYLDASTTVADVRKRYQTLISSPEERWPAAGFTDTLFRCEGEAGGAPCSVASSDVSSRSRRFD
ncbi:MCP four helix bundle domain-containing protein [Methylorubrum rhodesianum]|uniref:MCP four helix bundle domain-containing protein n=1 Tax=Methylorubrum rhodesianum TaxID=29427 RepID=UPI0037454719